MMKKGGYVKCKLCGKIAEMVGHLASGCGVLAQRGVLADA